MCDDTGDPPEFFCVTMPKARREHRCCECRRLIPTGEVYVRSSGKWDSGVQAFRRHLACAELVEFIEEVVCGGHGYVYFGGLQEEIHEAGQYLDQDHDAWEAAGLEVPNPLMEVLDFIKSSYPAWTLGVQR